MLSSLSPNLTWPELFLRLILATVLGGIIGLEREAIHRPAGLRTHTLVSVGSALFTLLSIYFAWWEGEFREPGRIAAQIVSGIGFLGAGTILRQRAGIRGLTTAASLWAVAGIGMAAGAGYYLGAVATTLFVFLSLTLLRRLEYKMKISHHERMLFAECQDRDVIPRIASILSSLQIEIRESSAGVENGKVVMRLLVRLPPNPDYQELMSRFIQAGVVHYEWDESN